MSVKRKLRMLGLYAASRLQSGRYAESFHDIRTYCMFIGYPRTGHSLIGSLLDAHPNIVIAHELDALRFFRRGFSRQQVFHLLLENSRRMAAAGRRHSGYSYEVPSQWQGRFEKLQVLGDKKGATSTFHFYRDPGLVDSVAKSIGVEMKFVHVIRNPFDVLATMTRRQPRKTLDHHMELFFTLCSTNQTLKQRLHPAQIFDLRLEAFIADPKSHLARLCAFLGVEAGERYLADCAAIVFKSPQKSRFEIQWSEESIAKVNDGIRAFSFLSGYAYDENAVCAAPLP
jgi:hypothetical protein